MDVKKIVLLGLAAVALILGGLGIVLARCWPFSQERVTQSAIHFSCECDVSEVSSHLFPVSRLPCGSIFT